MIKNVIITSFRNLKKRKFYSILNISGLAVSISFSFLLWLYVQEERSYDQHFENADRIYRVNADFNINGQRDIYSNTPRPVAPSLKAEFPEVEEAIRLRGVGDLNTHTGTLVVDDMRINTTEIFIADSSVFKVFKFELTKGNDDKALARPNSLVISESLAKSLFGNNDALGNIVQLSGNSPKTLEITGVMKDNNNNTHLEINALVSWSTFASASDMTQWYGAHTYTYILLNENNDIKGLKNKIPGFYDKYMKETFNNIGGTADLIFQPLTTIHLDSEYIWEPYPHGSKTNVRILGIVIIFLIVIACVNYVNLATARSTERAGEVGIRKVLGSSKKLLLLQFLSESILVAVLSGMLAILLALVLLPYFNRFSGMELGMTSFLSIQNITYIFLLSVTIGLMAGIYPALYLISFEPISVLKGKITTKGEMLRKILVVSQYCIASILIVGMLLVAQQTKFIKNKDVGFEKENVVTINVPRDEAVSKHIDSFIEKLKNKVYVVGVTHSAFSLSEQADQWVPEFENPDGTRFESKIEIIDVDHDFIQTIGAKLIEGRNFDRLSVTDEESAFLINEAAVKKFGWTDHPLEGKFIYDEDEEGNLIKLHVIGVVGDFNLGASYQNVNPLMILLSTSGGKNLYIRIKGKEIFASIKDIENAWKDFFPTHDFEYSFLDQELATLYSNEENFLNLLTGFSFIIVFITSLGVVGLISFTIQQKKKELAIRKVNGSSIKDIIVLLSKKFVSLLFIANILAVPISYYLIKEWLANFEQRIELSIWPFALSLLICGVFTAFALIYHTSQAVLANPIDALQHE